MVKSLQTRFKLKCLVLKWVYTKSKQREESQNNYIQHCSESFKRKVSRRLILFEKSIGSPSLNSPYKEITSTFFTISAIYSNQYLPTWIIFFAEVGTKFCQKLQILSKSFENYDKFFKNCQIRSHWMCHFLLMQGLCFIESKLLAVKISENILSFTTDYRQFKKQLLQNPNKSFPSSSTYGSDLG